MAKTKPGKRPYLRTETCTLDAWNAIVHHSLTIDELKLEREEAFEARDNALGQLEEADANSDEAHEAGYEHSKAVRAIDNIAASIKFHQSELQKAIRAAIKGEEVKIYDFNPDAAKKRKDDDEAKKATGSPDVPGQAKLNLVGGGGGGGGEDLRPVGRPGKKPAAIAPMPADGVDEQLDASVNELGGEGKDQLSDATIAALVKAGFTTIRHVALQLDGTNGRIVLGDKIGKGEKVVAQIVKATELYRAKHRKAILNAQHEAMKAEAQKAQA